MLETYYFDLFWDPTPTTIPRGNAREDTKGMNTTRNDQRVLATAITRSVVRGSTKHAHLKHFKSSRWPTSNIPAISSIQQWSFITWWFGVEPCSPSKGSFHDPTPALSGHQTQLGCTIRGQGMGHGFELLTLCGWAFLRRGQRSMVRHFIPAAWVTFQVGHGGTENQVLIRGSSWKKDGQWMGNGRTPWLNISNIFKHVFLLETFKILHEQILLVQRWCVNNLPLWDNCSYCMLNGSGLDLAWILPAHAAEMGAPSPQNMPSWISFAPKQGQIKP